MELLTLKARKSLLKRSFITVDLEGPLDINTAEVFESTLEDLFKKGQYKIILNMEKLTYVSSSGFGKLYKAIKIIHENRGDLKMTHVNPGIQKTFDLLDLPSLLRGLKNRKEVIQPF